MLIDQSITLRAPTLEDGMDVHHLVEICPPLDPNSLYCNYLQCGHFSDTSIAAFWDTSARDVSANVGGAIGESEEGEVGGAAKKSALVGFISAYRVPADPQTLFIWQVAVAEQVRGQGLAKRMILEILSRRHCSDIRFIETTITPTNQSSWALFRGVAKALKADLTTHPWLDQEKHFSGMHESEDRIRIGAFRFHQADYPLSKTQREPHENF